MMPASQSKDVVAVVATVVTDVEAVVVTVATDVVAVVVTSSPVVTVPRLPRMASAVVEIAVVVAVVTDHKLPSPSLLMVKKLLKALLNAAVAMASVSVAVTASVAMATKASPVKTLTPWTVRTVLDVADAVTERTETAEVAEATMPSPKVLLTPKNPRMKSQRENARSVNLVRKRKKSPLRKSKKSDSLLTITWQLSKLRALANLPRRKLVLTKPWMLRLLSSPRNTTLPNKSNLPPRSTLRSTPSLLAPLLVLSSSDSRLLLMLVMSLMLVASVVVVVVTDPARTDPNNPVAVKVVRLLSMTTISPPYDQ
jgi:hypothetical protein